MKKTTAALLLLPLTAACEIDLSGLDFGSIWGGGMGGFSPTTVVVQGTVTVGRFRALDREVTVQLFDPAQPSTPVALSVSSSGQYTFDLGASPGPRVCDYLVRGILWNGETTQMQPVFALVPSPCALSPSLMSGTALSLPAYGPLTEPFVIQGHVFLEGRTARTDEATVEVSMRDSTQSGSISSLRTDAGGRYRLETNDAAQRYALCSGVRAQVRDALGGIEDVQLGSLPHQDCGNVRTLPDARLGTLKAAVGSVYLGEAWLNRPVGAGEAWAELLRMDDGTVVGERFETLDDGSFHVWFPHDLRQPGCSWLLRVTLASGSSEIRNLFPTGDCQGPAYHPVSFVIFAAGAGQRELVVEDPLGDNTGLTDLAKMTLRFDPRTGNYEILLSATAAQPFQGEFRVNINLFNPARQSFFADTMNDIRLETPTTTLRLTGYHPALRSWLPGDQVHTNSLGGTPNPTGSTLFRSGVSHFPMGYLTNEDVIAFADVTVPAVVVPASD